MSLIPSYGNPGDYDDPGVVDAKVEPFTPPSPTTVPGPATNSRPGKTPSPVLKGGTVPTAGGEALKALMMVFVLIIIYDVVTHGTAWSGVFANISSHLTNFVSVKPLGTVQTTTSAWSNVL